MIAICFPKRDVIVRLSSSGIQAGLQSLFGGGNNQKSQYSLEHGKLFQPLSFGRTASTIASNSPCTMRAGMSRAGEKAGAACYFPGRYQPTVNSGAG
jgi:hypothetical protein